MRSSKITLKLLSLILALVLSLAVLAACDKTEEPTSSGNQEAPQIEHVDYAGATMLDMSSSTLKKEVTVKSYIDGDTTHFYFPNGNFPNGVLKARYLSVNTPESTGKIEEWGKAASNFTKEALKSATSIIIESDDGKWNADSTGDRYLVWVWYKPEGSTTYRNLNIELLQNGLAIASNSSNNRYGTTCMSAIAQAKAEKLCVYSGTKDPDFFYGEASEITIKELRCNIEEYTGTKVAFEGIITKNNNNGIYVEEYDPETDMYYGIYVYYGFNLYGAGLNVISVGNRVRLVGSVQFYETGGTYQVSDLNYDLMNPKDPNNIQKISDGHTPSYVELDVQKFANGKVELEVGDEKRTYDYAELVMSTSVSIKKLKVIDVYTTVSDNENSDGAMTLTCVDESGTRIDVRTIVLRDENGNKITENYFLNKTIDVNGYVDYFNGDYQIKVFSLSDISFN